jgi:peptide/nickel transport system substrate-binding protein
LAERWENPTPTTWRFHLRRGVHFTAGGTVDAAAVVATVELLKAHPDYAVATEVTEIIAARAIDAGTVEIETALPDAILPRRFGLIRIVDPAAWARLGPDGFARTPSGSGPYSISSWTGGGSTIALIANPKSWRAPTSVTRLEITTLKDATSRVQALLSDQVDVSLSLNPDDLAPLKDAGFKTYISTAGQVLVWALPNILKSATPLKDVRVRQALNYAVDKDAIAGALLQGIAGPASQGATPGTFGFDPDLSPYPYDPAKARALLTEAGYPNGFKLIADVVVGLGPADTQIHQKTAADLRAIGIDVELRNTPYTARPQKFYGGQ